MLLSCIRTTGTCWACLLALAARTASGAIFLAEDFSGGGLNESVWLYQQRNWPVGQTWFNRPPVVSGGLCTLVHHTFNPQDPGGSCLGTEVCSKASFPRNGGLQIEARVRLRTPVASGLVASIFTYTDKEVAGHLESDEIDFEFLSKQLNDSAPAGDRVFLTSWNDFGAPGSGYYDGVHHWAVNPVVPGLDLSAFNTFRFRWLGNRVEWSWRAAPGECRLIDEMSSPLPDEAAPLCFNLWAAASGWTEAYDASMRPAASQEGDAVCYYDLDWAVVCSWAAPEFGDADADGDVDLIDLNILAAHRGQTGIWPDGDFSDDGMVNVGDLGILGFHYGYGVGGGAAGTVPEAGTGVLLLAAALLAGGGRRWRRRSS